MRQAAHEDQLAEVLVLGNGYPLLFECKSQEFFVCSPWVPLQSRQDIVP